MIMRSLSFAALGVVLVACGGSVQEAQTPKKADAQESTADVQPNVAAHSPAWGDPVAPVTLVAFGSLADAACADQSSMLRVLRDSYGPTKLRIVFRHARTGAPASHDRARHLAEVAQAVAAQGGAGAFYAFLESAYRRPDASASDEDVLDWAKQAGAYDVAALRAAMTSPKVRAQVDADYAVADKLGVKRCSFALVNGREVGERIGFKDLDTWRGVIDREEKHAETLLSTGLATRDKLYAKIVEDNKKAGDDDAAEEAPRMSEARTVVGGLSITDVEVGKGPAARTGDTVRVHYTGHLADGSVFDSSSGRGPLEFRLGQGQVIKGWDMGVSGMKVGGKRKLVIPPGLAYGSKSMGNGKIPPNSTLHFDVELVEIR